MKTDLPRIGIACGLLLALAGCVDKGDPDTIDTRSVERWNHLIAHQAEQAYDYLTPGFRSTQSRETYASSMNSRPVQWKEAKFKSKECDAERCKVQVDVTYSLLMPGAGNQSGGGTRTQTETWLLVDGAWYFLPSS
ncbi:MAG: hypothetical protein EOP90_06530 [Lysobacteraceae bacterium]|nr:MAG: hypothetical protein EOP90_06530 [Xanthomonadaceae bacterium]